MSTCSTISDQCTCLLYQTVSLPTCLLIKLSVLPSVCLSICRSICSFACKHEYLCTSASMFISLSLYSVITAVSRLLYLPVCLFSVFLSFYLIAFLCISAFLFISQPVLTCLSFVSWSAQQFLVRRICSCLFMCLTVPMSSCFILCPYCTSAYRVGVCSIFLCVDNLCINEIHKSRILNTTDQIL